MVAADRRQLARPLGARIAGGFDRALDLFFRHRDKGYSFRDCTSFAVMKELKLPSVPTTDKHFKQMGFQVEPTGSPGAKKQR